MKHFSILRYTLIRAMAVAALFIGVATAGLVHAQGTMSGEINTTSDIQLMTGQGKRGASVQGEEPRKEADKDRQGSSGNGNSGSGSRSSAGNSNSAGNDEANPGGRPRSQKKQ